MLGLTTCFGPRTAWAGLVATTWPVTSQSNSMRMAARRCLTVGFSKSLPRAEEAADGMLAGGGDQARHQHAGAAGDAAQRPGSVVYVACVERSPDGDIELRRVDRDAPRPAGAIHPRPLGGRHRQGQTFFQLPHTQQNRQSRVGRFLL
jgi:hypothetical protein